MPTVNLTDARVKSARCESAARLRELRDATVRGLELRVTPSGAKSWRLHYTRRSDGKRRVIGLGSYPALSLKQARTKARALQGQIENDDTRADLARGTQERKRAATFGDIAAEWLTRHGEPNKSPRALRDDRSMLARHILPEIGAMRAADIAKRDIIALLDTVAAKPDARGGRAAGSRMTHRPNRVFELLRAICRWAVGRDLIQIDPTWGIPAPIKKEKPRDRELATDEIARLWRALDRTPIERRSTRGLPRGTSALADVDIPMTRALALTLKLALVTAQRIGEVAGMSRSELDLSGDKSTWTVPGERSKNGQPNRVPLSPLAVELIRQARVLAGNSDWLFPGASPANPNAPIDPHAPTRALARARSAIGLDDFRVHDLRRTAASRMAEMGISPHTISLVLNHVSARKGTVTGKVYITYSYDREKREALEAWGARLAAIVGFAADATATE